MVFQMAAAISARPVSLVPRPSRRQHILEDRRISLVAGELEHPLLALYKPNHHGPRPGPGSPVVHSNLVADLVGSDASESFDELQILCRTHESGLGREVRSIGNQR